MSTSDVSHWKDRKYILKKREEQRLEAAQTEFLRHHGITKLDKGKKNHCIREKQEQRV